MKKACGIVRVVGIVAGVCTSVKKAKGIVRVVGIVAGGVFEKVYSAPPSPLFVEGFHGSPPYKNNAGLVVTMVMRTAMHCNGEDDS